MNLSSIAKYRTYVLVGILVIGGILTALYFYEIGSAPKNSTPPANLPVIHSALPTSVPILSPQPITASPTGESNDSTEITKLKKITPFAKSDFKVVYNSTTDTVEVTFFPRLNHDTPEALAQYKQDLKDYKAEFEKWLADNTIDISKLRIAYDPDPAKYSQ